MDSTAITDVIDQQDWLDPVADGLQSAVGKAYDSAGTAGTKVADFLHGVWLGHPLHPVLTDIPLGSWTTAAVLDILEATSDRKDLAPCADAAIAVGLVGAVGSAVTGLTDWYLLHERSPRRVGVAHALMNVGATSLYATSWFLRRGGKRETARMLSWMGYALVTSAAYLGGTLVYERKIGVDHAPEEIPLEDFTPVLPAEDLPDNELKRVELAGIKILLVRRNGEISAMAETCSHMGGPLSEGTLEDGVVKCPWHGSRFALKDGHVVDGPATFPQPCFEARIQGGQIEIRASKLHNRQPAEV